VNHQKPHEEDLTWYYRQADGELGLSSSLGPMINMAMSGISQGGNISQHTRATFDHGSPVERQRRIKHTVGALDAAHQRVLGAHYGDRRGLERAGESAKEHGERVARYSPAERCFGELAYVVEAIGIVPDVRKLDNDRRAVLHPLKSESKADLAARAKTVATRVQEAKKAIDKVAKAARKVLSEAQAAYDAQAKAMPPGKATRSLSAYKAWLAGGVA
jgi:hypothetical protein